MQEHREKRQLGIFGWVFRTTTTKNEEEYREKDREGEKKMNKNRTVHGCCCCRLYSWLLYNSVFFRSLLVVFPSLHNVCFIFYFIFLFMSVFRRFSEHSIFFIVFSCTLLVQFFSFWWFLCLIPFGFCFRSKREYSTLIIIVWRIYFHLNQFRYSG